MRKITKLMSAEIDQPAVGGQSVDDDIVRGA